MAEIFKSPLEQSDYWSKETVPTFTVESFLRSIDEFFPNVKLTDEQRKDSAYLENLYKSMKKDFVDLENNNLEKYGIGYPSKLYKQGVDELIEQGYEPKAARDLWHEKNYNKPTRRVKLSPEERRIYGHKYEDEL